MKVIFEEKFINAMLDMLEKQEREHLEQFATMTGNMTDEGLTVENFELWDNSLLEQTETTVTPSSDTMWDSIGENMNAKQEDFIITLHTHPENYGTNPTGKLDSSDTKAFKDWTKNFNDFGHRICINGIITGKNGLLLTYYVPENDKFNVVEYQVVPNKINSNSEARHI